MKEYVAGIDIGGTTIKLALFPRGGQAETVWEVKTPVFENIGKIWQVMADAIIGKMQELGIPRESLKAVGAGLPGAIWENGYLPRCVNIGMKDCYPARELEKLLGCPVRVDNDADVAALGEVKYGAAKGCNHAIMITLGTGVGGGMISGGKIISGSHGLGGEIGHTNVNPDETRVCNCGGRGCLEQYASATGMVNTCKDILEKKNTPTPLRAISALTSKDICEAAGTGDPIAEEVLDIYGKYMGLALAHAVCCIDPEVIVIGGGVSKAGEVILKPIRKYLDRFDKITVVRPELKIAELGNEAGVYGAAALAEDLL